MDTSELQKIIKKSLFADEMPVPGTSVDEIDVAYYKGFIKKKYNRDFEDLGIELNKSLENLNLLREGVLTLTGLLFFSRNRAKYKPLFSIQCVSVNTSTLTGNGFTDNEPSFDGNMRDVFEKTMAFIDRNLKKIPSGKSFNSQAVWEIPFEVFEEILTNSLIHRDYFINSTIKVLIFSDRIEIISPGKLPNSLTIENIKSGISIARNPLIQTIAQHTLPYKELGTGVMRAISLYPDITFDNDTDKNLFIVTLRRRQ